MEVLERIGASGYEVASIVITAHVSIETAIEAMRRGAFDYLPKPFEPAELVLRVERALRWQRLRQEAERRLLELNVQTSQLGTIVSSLGDGVLVVNVDGEVVLSNPAACQAMGLGAGPCFPAPLGDIVRDPELLESIRRAGEALAAATAPASVRVFLAGRTYMAKVVPIRAPKGQPLGSATVLRDITELVTLEEAKARFTSKVAHELKSPLAAVQGFVKAILAMPEMPRADVDGLLERCGERVDGMAQLVRDLLDLARAEAMPLRDAVPLSAGELVAEVLDQQRVHAERAGVALSADVPEGLPEVYGDRDDFLVLLGNLVSNAVKYNRPGGTVTISLRAQGDRLRLEVADTGLGIPTELIPRLGEEFFRVGTPDRKHIVGTGLGLSLVKRTVEAYGGHLDIYSKPGEGSAFTVWLPLGGPMRREAGEGVGPRDLAP
jgi:PAS domain S-box-containing protein